MRPAFSSASACGRGSVNQQCKGGRRCARPFSGTARSSSTRCPSRSRARGRCWSRRSPAASAAPTCTRASTPTAWSRWRGIFPGRKPMDLSRDVVFGHEFCCEVLDYGPATARKLKAGTRVCSLPALLTPEGPKGIGYSNDNVGGYAERMLLSEALLLEVPNGLAAEHAALTEPLAVGVHAVAKAKVARRRGAAGDRLRPGRAGGDRGAEDERLAPDRRRGLFAGAPGLGAKSSAPTSSSIPRMRSPTRPGPSTPRCRRSRKPRGRRCRRGCRR